MPRVSPVRRRTLVIGPLAAGPAWQPLDARARIKPD